MRKDRKRNQEKSNNLKNLLGDFGEMHKDKTQSDLIDEVKKIKSNMSEEEFRRQIRTMDKIRGFLNEKQQKKLDKLIEMLKNN